MPNSRADNRTLLAKFSAKEGRIGQLIEMTPLISVAEDDAGVEAYFMHVDPDQTTVWFYEMYADDAAAAAAHRSDPRVRAVLDDCAPTLAEREVVEGTLIGSKHINLGQTELPKENPR
jgi:quinol monooxygenase YgiN